MHFPLDAMRTLILHVVPHSKRFAFSPVEGTAEECMMEEPVSEDIRKGKCPILLRVFIGKGGHNKVAEYDQSIDHTPRNAKEVYVYTWKDATLREIAALIREQTPDALDARLHFALVYPNAQGKHILKEIGMSVGAKALALQKAADLAAEQSALQADEQLGEQNNEPAKVSEESVNDQNIEESNDKEDGIFSSEGPQPRTDANEEANSTSHAVEDAAVKTENTDEVSSEPEVDYGKDDESDADDFNDDEEGEKDVSDSESVGSARFSDGEDAWEGNAGRENEDNDDEYGNKENDAAAEAEGGASNAEQGDKGAQKKREKRKREKSHLKDSNLDKTLEELKYQPGDILDVALLDIDEAPVSRPGRKRARGTRRDRPGSKRAPRGIRRVHRR